MRNFARVFRESGLPGYCKAIIWIGGFGWGVSLFLICTSVLKFEYRPFQGIVATPAFLLYPEQRDFWSYLLALIMIPLVAVITYVLGVVITTLFSPDQVRLRVTTSTFLLGWILPFSYAYRPSVDWVLLALSIMLFVFINGVIWLRQPIDLTVFAFWPFSGAAVGIALLTSPFIDVLAVRQHPIAFLLLFTGLGCLGYLILRRQKWVQSITLSLLPLYLLSLHPLLWSAVYQENREIFRQGSTTFTVKFDCVLVAISLMVGLASFALQKRWESNYRGVLKVALFYVVIPLLLYVLAYIPNIHGPLDLFHEGERLAPGYAIAQGKTPYKEVVFIHGFLRDPGIALLSFNLFGYSVEGLRTLEHFLSPIVIVLSYYLALVCLSPEVAVLYSSLALTGFWPFFYDWRMIPVLFVMITLIAFIAKGSRLFLVLTSLGICLALVTSVDVGIVGLFVGCLFYGLFSLFNRRADILAVFLLSLGSCLVGLAILLARMGLLSDCLQWNLHLLLVNTHWNGMPFPYPLDTWAKSIKALLSPVASILSITYLAVKGLRREWTNQCWIIFVLLVANAVLYNRAIVGGQLYSSHIQDGSHLAPLLLMVILLKGEQFPRHLFSILLAIALLVPTPLSNGRTLLSLLGKLPEKNRIVVSEDWILSENERIGSIFLPREQYQLVSELADFFLSAESFWDFTDHGMLYFLSEHTSPTRFYATHHIITIEDQKEVITSLEKYRPSFVLYRSGTGWDAIAGIDRTVRNFLVSEYLLKNYHFYKRIGGFVVLERGAPEVFPQPLSFKIDLGHMPVLWAQDFGGSYERLRSESVLDNWQPNSDVHLTEVTNSKWSLFTTGSDPWLEKAVILNPQSVKYFLLCIQAKGVGELKAQIFWRSENEGFSEERSVLFNLLPDGKEHLYLIPLASFPSWAWSGTVTGLRFDPASRPSVEVSVIGWESLYYK